MLKPFDYAGLSLYLLLMVWIGWKTRRTPKFGDYALASKQLPAFLIFASLAATYIGPGFTMGAVAKGSEIGILAYFSFLPFALQTVVVGFFFAPKLAAFKGCSTIGDVMRVQFGKETQILTGIMSAVVCMLFTAFLAKVGGSLLQSVTGISLTTGVVVFTFASVFYTVYGGLRATVLTDTVQFIMFSLVIPIIAIAILASPHFNFNTAAESFTSLANLTLEKEGAVNIFGVALSFLLGETLIPPYANRALAAPTPDISKKAFVMAGIFAIFWLALMTGIGGAANQVLDQGAQRGDSTLFSITAAVLPPGFYGLLVMAVVAVIMSSQDSVVNAGTVSLTRDLVVPFKSLDDKDQVVLSRMFCVIIALGGIAVAAYLPGIIEALLLIYSLWAPTVLVPLLLSLVIRKPGRHAAWPAIISGGLASVGWRWIPEYSTFIPAILPGVVVSAVAFVVGHVISKKWSLGK